VCFDLDSPLVQAADDAHGLMCAVAGIKASPPSYTVLTSRLSKLLIDAFSTAAGPLIGAAIRKIAAISDRPGTIAERAAAVTGEMLSLREALIAAGIQLTDDDKDLLLPALRGSYKLGLKEMSTAANVSMSFGVADADAIAGLNRNGIYWVGKHYGDVIPQGVIDDVLREMVLEKGYGAEAAGEKLASMFKNAVFKRSESYWKGFSHVITTRARTFGSLSTMVNIEVEEYEYVNPMDERTSPVCEALNGTIFRVEHAIDLRDRLLQAQDPEEWKAIAPWVKVSDITDATGALLSAPELVAMGVIMPPQHMFCRSQILIR